MFGKPSLITRIAVGKTIGLLFGLIGFISLPYFWPQADWLIRWGVLLWYVTFGAVIALAGVMTYHPVIKLPLPWWFQSPLFGAWLNFVLAFFAYDKLQAMMISLFGADSRFISPFWIVLEGAIIGFIIGYAATKFGGEGKETVTRLPEKGGNTAS